MNNEDVSGQEIIKSILQDLLKHMGVAAEIETRLGEGTLIFNLKTQDSSLLIGQHGGNLAAFQYLARLLAFKKLSHSTHFIVDVEGYKQDREEFLRELARAAVVRVRETKETLLLKPMSAYERRVVHAEISGLPDVTTESSGEEPERRVVIKPKP